MTADTPPSYFDLVGGADVVARLVERFYHHMATLPEARDVLALHPDLDRARERLTLFLTGWLGGPPVYVERFGHPRLRARHLPFAIGARERDQWLLCMDRALEDVVADPAVRASLQRAFRPVADHMVNR
jgi:hemoglobin